MTGLVASPRRMLIGGYAAPNGGLAGIRLVEHDIGRGTLSFAGLASLSPSPSFLAISPDGEAVYAVEEDSAGAVHAFRWTSPSRTELERIAVQPTEGADPCHLVVHQSGRFLLTANYTSGSVAVHPIENDGSLGPVSDVIVLHGCGPDSARQASAHAHMIATTDDGTEISVADLGSDRVWRLSFDAHTGRLQLLPRPLVLHPGSGPRQILFNPAGDLAFVLGELDGSLTVSSWPPQETETDVTTRAGSIAKLPVDNLAAALVASADGHRLFASHRGADIITVFDVEGRRVVPIADLPSAGVGPRHLALVGEVLYVANQDSDAVTAMTLSVDRTQVENALTAAVPSPSCVLHLPDARLATLSAQPAQ